MDGKDEKYSGGSKPGITMQDLAEYARKLEAAAKSKNLHKYVDTLFYICAELACQDGAPTEQKFGWDPCEGILCRSSEAAVLTRVAVVAAAERTASAD